MEKYVIIFFFRFELYFGVVKCREMLIMYRKIRMGNLLLKVYCVIIDKF